MIDVDLNSRSKRLDLSRIKTDITGIILASVCKLSRVDLTDYQFHFTAGARSVLRPWTEIGTERN